MKLIQRSRKHNFPILLFLTGIIYLLVFGFMNRAPFCENPLNHRKIGMIIKDYLYEHKREILNVASEEQIRNKYENLDTKNYRLRESNVSKSLLDKLLISQNPHKEAKNPYESVSKTFKRLDLTQTFKNPQHTLKTFNSSKLQNTGSTINNVKTQIPTTHSSLIPPPDCDKLFAGDEDEIKRVKSKWSAQTAGEEDLALTADPRTLDCDTFKRRHGFSSAPSSQSERQFPLAFSVRVHRNAAQVLQLLRTIYAPQNFYCVHVDARSAALVRDTLRACVACFTNMRMLEPAERYVYGGMSPVRIDLRCMRLARDHSSYRYFINLAGLEFPLRTNTELVSILTLLNGTNDIENYPFTPYLRRRIDYTYKPDPTGVIMVQTNITKEPYSGALRLVKGNSYNTFSRRFVDWVLSEPAPVRQLYRWLSDTYAPDETFWATLQHAPSAPGHSPVMVTQINKSHLSREVIWSYDAAYCSSRYVRGVCLLSAGELRWLADRWELFANKFDARHDRTPLDCLEQRLRTRGNRTDLVPWQRIRDLPHVRYRQDPRKYRFLEYK